MLQVRANARARVFFVQPVQLPQQPANQCGFTQNHSQNQRPHKPFPQAQPALASFAEAEAKLRGTSRDQVAIAQARGRGRRLIDGDEGAGVDGEHEALRRVERHLEMLIPNSVFLQSQVIARGTPDAYRQTAGVPNNAHRFAGKNLKLEHLPDAAHRHFDFVAGEDWQIQGWIFRGLEAIHSIFFPVGAREKHLPAIRKVGEIAGGLDRLGHGRRAKVFLTTGSSNLTANIIHPPVGGNGNRQPLVIVRDVGVRNGFLKFPRRSPIGFDGADQRQSNGAVILDPFFMWLDGFGEAGEYDSDQITDGKAVEVERKRAAIC